MLNIIREKRIKTIMRGIPWLFNGEDQWLFNPEYSLEGLMLKLKLQYFGHLM